MKIMLEWNSQELRIELEFEEFHIMMMIKEIK